MDIKQVTFGESQIKFFEMDDEPVNEYYYEEPIPVPVIRKPRKPIVEVLPEELERMHKPVGESLAEKEPIDEPVNECYYEEPIPVPVIRKPRKPC